jgi:hypothetical protein
MIINTSLNASQLVAVKEPNSINIINHDIWESINNVGNG